MHMIANRTRAAAHTRCHAPSLGLAVMLAAVLVPVAAHAEANPWRLGGSLGLQRDSNLYRLGNGREAGLPADRSKSDTITTVSLLAGLDQPMGRHRLHADASLRSQRYADNGMLDNQGWGFAGGFEWSAPERLSGALNLQSHRNLARFDADSTQVQNLQKNIERITQAEAIVRLGLVTRYSAELGYTHREVDYSASAYAVREYRQGTLMAGLRFRPSGALGFGLGWRHARTELPRYFAGTDTADRPQRDDLDFSVQWQASGASDLSARLSASRTRYERLTERDWSGLTGHLTWVWRPSGKLRSTLTLLRDDGRNADFIDLGIFGGLLSDQARTSTSLQARLAYELSAKLQADASLRRAHRTLENTVSGPLGAPVISRGNDDTTRYALGLRWQPTRGSQLGCDIARERRSADGGLSLPQQANTWGCQAQLMLQ